MNQRLQLVPEAWDSQKEQTKEPRLECGITQNDESGEWAAFAWAFDFEGQKEEQQGATFQGEWGTKEDAIRYLAEMMAELKDTGITVVPAGEKQ